MGGNIQQIIVVITNIHFNNAPNITAEVKLNKVSNTRRGNEHVPQLNNITVYDAEAAARLSFSWPQDRGELIAAQPGLISPDSSHKK